VRGAEPLAQLELGVVEQLLDARLCLLMIARPVGDRDHVAHALLDLVHFAYSSFDLHWSIGIADYPRPIIGPECQWRDNTSSVEARPAGDA
jgi:hypothetical protein